MNRLFLVFGILLLMLVKPPFLFADNQTAIEKDISEGGTVEVSPTEQYVAEEQSTMGTDPDAEAMLGTNEVTMLTAEDEKIVLEAAEALKTKNPVLSQKLKTMVGD